MDLAWLDRLFWSSGLLGLYPIPHSFVDSFHIEIAEAQMSALETFTCHRIDLCGARMISLHWCILGIDSPSAANLSFGGMDESSLFVSLVGWEELGHFGH